VVINVAAVIFMLPLGISTATSVQVGRAFGSRDPAGAGHAGRITRSEGPAHLHRSRRRNAQRQHEDHCSDIDHHRPGRDGQTADPAGHQAHGGKGGHLEEVGRARAIADAALLLFPLREWVASAYTADQDAIALIAPALALTCLFLAPDAVQVVAAQALRARGEVWIPTLTHLISYGVIMGPLAWWLAIPLGMGVNGIVWSVIVTSFVSMAFLLARFRMLDVKDRGL